LDVLRSLPQLERLYTNIVEGDPWVILPHLISQRRLTTYHVRVVYLPPEAAVAKEHLQRCNDFLSDVTDLEIPLEMLEYIASKKVIKLSTTVTVSSEDTFFRLLSRYRTTLTHLKILRYPKTSGSELTTNFINQLAEVVPLLEDLSLSCRALSKFVVSTFAPKSA
jgi:hypothetical protein